MRNDIEPRREPSFVFEKDDEPFPIDPELIEELLVHLRELWHQHGEAKSKEDNNLQEKLESSLLLAYQQLDTLKGQLRNPDLSDDLKDELEFELSFSCNHLRKVIKFPTE